MQELLKAAAGPPIRLTRLFGSFLEQQADIDEAVVTLRQTALHRAARQGHMEVVRLLLERQADVNRHDEEGCTPQQMKEMRQS